MAIGFVVGATWQKPEKETSPAQKECFCASEEPEGWEVPILLAFPFM